MIITLKLESAYGSFDRESKITMKIVEYGITQ